jgi:hypothetical protein
VSCAGAKTGPPKRELLSSRASEAPDADSVNVWRAGAVSERPVGRGGPRLGACVVGGRKPTIRARPVHCSRSLLLRVVCTFRSRLPQEE